MNLPPVAVDASVAVKWVVDELHSDQALALLRACSRERRVIIGPPHLPGEVTNAIYQHWRSADPVKHLSSSRARDALSRFLAVHVELLHVPYLYGRALDFSQAHNLPSIYDGIYAVVAEQFGAELWTADQRLLNAVGPAVSWLRSISEFPLPSQ